MTNTIAYIFGVVFVICFWLVIVRVIWEDIKWLFEILFPKKAHK